MLFSGMDNLTQAPREAWSAPVEPGFAPPAPQAGAAPSFGDYLRQAQSQAGQTQQEATDSAPCATSSSSVQEQPHPEGPRESPPSQTAVNGQAPQEGPAGSPHQSPDGQDRGETAAGDLQTAGQEHRDKNSGEAAVVVDLTGVAAAALPPAPAPVDNAKDAPAALPVEPSAAAAAATRAGVTPGGTSGDGKATVLAGPSGHALVAATSAGLPEGQPAQPAADQAAAPSGDTSSKSSEADKKAAAVAEAQPAAAALGPSAAGAATEPPLPTAPDSPSAWATSRLDAGGEASGEAARLQAPQPAATAATAAAAAAMAATWSGRGNRASKAGEAAGAGDAIGPTSTPSGAAVATPGAGGQTSASQAPAAATQGPQTADLAPVDRARFVQRVEQAVQSMGDQAGSLRLRLSPPELGSLRISLSVRQGELNARLEVETSSARNLLLDHLGELRDRLAQQNIKIQQFDVDLADRRPGGMADQAGQFGQNAQSHSGQGGGRSAPAAAPPGDVPSPADSAASQPVGGSQLNVVV